MEENKLEIGGLYRHYKNSEMIYEVIGEAIHSETLEKLVLYKSMYAHGEYKKGTIWARPKEMFLGTVNINGKEVNRFEYIGDSSNA